MNPVFTQFIAQPEFGYILPQAVAFAALGTSDKAVNPLRKQGKLIEGEHFVRVPQRTGLPKIHWTLTGLQALVSALDTDRANAFLADLTQWLQAHQTSANHDSAGPQQPRGDLAPPTLSGTETEYESASLVDWQPAVSLSATNHQEPQTGSGRYSLAELQELRVIAQTERDGQMLTLLDRAISALTANQPASPSQPVDRVVYMQPQKTTHINFLWHWQGGKHNQSHGSLEVFFGLLLVLVLLSGLWAIAIVSTQRPQPVYPDSLGLHSHVE